MGGGGGLYGLSFSANYFFISKPKGDICSLCGHFFILHPLNKLLFIKKKHKKLKPSPRGVARTGLRGFPKVANVSDGGPTVHQIPPPPKYPTAPRYPNVKQLERRGLDLFRTNCVITGRMHVSRSSIQTV